MLRSRVYAYFHYNQAARPFALRSCIHFDKEGHLGELSLTLLSSMSMPFRDRLLGLRSPHSYHRDFSNLNSDVVKPAVDGVGHHECQQYHLRSV